MNNLTTDVAIIGGGLAGATAAAMLGRAGHNAMLIDPHTEQRPEFRCEKLDDSQLALLRLTGLADDVMPQTCADGKVWVVRYGRVVDRGKNSPAGILYHDLVNAVRQQIPASVPHIATKAAAISGNAGRQRVTLATGDEIEARLVILANGLNPGLRETLEIKREVLSPCHSISIGFDMKPDADQPFAFPALTVFPERPGQAMAYLSIFPVRGGMGANLFVYWNMEDPRLRTFRHQPKEALLELIPTLTNFTGPFAIDGQVSIRPIDLVRVNAPERPGLVLVGDAYSTSCPAAGTGVNKVLTDVQRLCSTYVPAWFCKGTIDAADVADFYADPVKVQCESDSLQKALWLRRVSTGTSMGLRSWRGARFVAQSALGRMRGLKQLDVTARDPSDLLRGA
ncbi:MAG: FAD-dependent monooxygenase [Aestuariivirga sp.]|nr:FAD-dependent monooxygenase [Aestuariivirga sp.]